MGKRVAGVPRPEGIRKRKCGSCGAPDQVKLCTYCKAPITITPPRPPSATQRGTR